MWTRRRWEIGVIKRNNPLGTEGKKNNNNNNKTMWPGRATMINIIITTLTMTTTTSDENRNIWVSMYVYFLLSLKWPISFRFMKFLKLSDGRNRIWDHYCNCCCYCYFRIYFESMNFSFLHTHTQPTYK